MALLSRVVLQGLLSGLANDEASFKSELIVPATPGPDFGIIATRDYLAGLATAGVSEVTTTSQARTLPAPAVVPINYATVGYARKEAASYDNQHLSQISISEVEHVLAALRAQLLYEQAVRINSVILNGTWHALSGALADGVRWNQAGGDPLNNLLAANRAIPGGANTIVMGPAAWGSLQTNVLFRGYLSNDSLRAVNEDQASSVLSGLFGRPVRIVVPNAMSSGESFVWDDDVFVARIAGAGTRGANGPLINPTALARIESIPMTPRMEQIIDMGVLGGEMIHLGHREVTLQVTPQLGVLYTDVNG